MASTLLFANSFSENPTTAIRDYSENQRDGVGVSTVCAADTVGYYLSLDGATDYYTVANTTDYCNANFSICFEVYFDTLAVSHNIINTYNIGLTKYCFSIYAETGTNNLVFYMDEDGGGTVTATRTITATAWHKVVCTYNNSTGAMKVYLNTFENVGTATLTNSVAQNGEFCIGVDSATKAVFFMDGRIRDMRFYTSIVSDAFISTFMTSSKGAIINMPQFTDSTGVVTPTSNFNVGDMLLGDGNIKAQLCLYAKSDTALYCLPFSEGGVLLNNQTLRRIGHRWDTARQYSIEISQEGEAINCHNLVKKFSEYDNGAYHTTSVTKNGVVEYATIISDNYTAKVWDCMIIADGITANKTVTLPDAGDMDGRTITVKNFTATYTLTVQGDEDIDGDASVDLLQYDSVSIYSNGSVYFIR